MEQDSIRTYRLRGSRITAPQQSALDKYWGLYGIEYSLDFLDLTGLFPDFRDWLRNG
jgi:tRNA (guanine-N7-)-methyltransferase